MDNDINVYPNTPLGIRIESDLNPEGDIIYGFITNLKQYPTKVTQIPADKKLVIDSSTGIDPVSGIYKFEKKEITANQVIMWYLLDDPQFSTDYIRYKNPSSTKELGNTIAKKMADNSKFSEEKIQKQNKIMWMGLGIASVIFLLLMIVYLATTMRF